MAGPALGPGITTASPNTVAENWMGIGTVEMPTRHLEGAGITEGAPTTCAIRLI